MVLQNYSWQDFALAAIVLSVVWYLGLWLYYKRIGLGSSGHAAEPLPHGWQDEVDELSGASQVMGVAKLDHGVSVVAADDFSFSESDESSSKEEKLGLIPDVQQEIKSICLLLAENDGTKEDFLSMFALLVRDQYPDVPKGSRAPLNAFIREQLPFQLSAEELEDLWS